jgi:xanthine dehydrogenase YagS FAD-binding subunit
VNNFEHVNARSITSAVNLLNQDGFALPISGGTDLLGQMKLGIIKPDRLVNLKAIAELNTITPTANGLDIGALATLDAIANHPVVREQYPVLFKAIEVTASPQLRNMGTIAGNLAQGSRCWYYRGRFKCWLKMGDECFAHDGEHSHHAIFGGGPCHTVSPSDPAPALVALGAEVSMVGLRGKRTMPVEDFFQLPKEASRQLTVLEQDEIITGIHIPEPDRGSKGTYLKAMERKVWSFALASVALQLNLEDNLVKNARIVLGGVAPKPWRLPQVEELLFNQPLSREIINNAAELAVAGAQPLSRNKYKIALVKGIVNEALSSINNV